MKPTTRRTSSRRRETGPEFPPPPARLPFQVRRPHDRLAERAARHAARLGGDHGLACVVRDVSGDDACPRGTDCTLRQTCPCCDLEEAHGDYCSRCGIPTGPVDWHPPIRSEAQEAASRRLVALRPSASKTPGIRAFSPQAGASSQSAARPGGAQLALF